MRLKLSQWQIFTNKSFKGLYWYRQNIFFSVQSSSSASSHPSSIFLPPILTLLTLYFWPPSTSPHVSPPATSPHLSSSPQHSELPTHFCSPPALPSSHLPLPLPLLYFFPLSSSSLISLVNNSAAVHTWVVTMKLHMGDLEDKWTIRVEELKTSPRLDYRARGICCLPG